MSTSIDLVRLVRRLEYSLPAYLEELAVLVNTDSGTFDKDGVDAVGELLRTRYLALGGTIEEYPHETYGDSFTVSWPGSGDSNILLIGHLDTVFSTGTAEKRPFRVQDERAHGPGVADMKSGDLSIVYAIQAFLDEGLRPFKNLTVVHNSDEEVGSPSSRALIQQEAGRANAAFVLEPGRENGDIVSARKGIADIRVHIYGRAAHAGVHHARGRSAILEMAFVIQALEGLNGTVPGATLNVGRVTAGDRINVVPDYAFAHLEVRAPTTSSMDQMLDAVRAAVANRTVPDTHADLDVSLEHSPMHKSSNSQRLVDLAQSLAESLDFSVMDTATGGASDGNTAASMGVPVLDGLGPIGGGAHTSEEYIDIKSIAPRITLLAGLIAEVGTGRA